MTVCCPKVVLYLQTKCLLMQITETEMMLMVGKMVQCSQLVKELDLYRKLF